MAARPSLQSVLPAGETLLLQHEAKYKKSTGQLVLTDKRILFQFDRAGAKALGLSLGDVQDHKVSSGSAAVLIKIVATLKKKRKEISFKFVSSSAADDRALWVEYLLQLQRGEKLVPRSRNQKIGRSNSELLAQHQDADEDVEMQPSSSSSTAQGHARLDEELVKAAEHRAALLVRNQELKNAYDSLVSTGAVTESEFWDSHKAMLMNESIRQQPVGRDTAMGHIEQQSTAANVTRIKLTANAIHQIFVDHPPVYRAYQETVPDKMTERQFWERYLRSRYFHRQQSLARGLEVPDMPAPQDEDDIDIFERYERELQAKRLERNSSVSSATSRISGSVDPSVDLTSADAVLSKPDQEFVNQTKLSNSLEKQARQNVIKKFNDHAAFVLSTVTTPGPGRSSTNPAPTQPSPSSLDAEQSTRRKYHKKLTESLRLQDLEDPSVKASISLQSLSLSGHQAGTHGHSVEMSPAVANRRKRKVTRISQDVSAWSTTHLRLADSKVSVDRVPALHVEHVSKSALCRQVLERVTTGAAAMARSAQSSHAYVKQEAKQEVKIFNSLGGKDHVVPSEFQAQVKNYFAQGSELLRHFWCCFPVSARTVSKLQRVSAGLSKMYDRLQTQRQWLNNSGQSHCTILLKPLEDSLLAALQRKNDYDATRRRWLAQRRKR